MAVEFVVLAVELSPREVSDVIVAVVDAGQLAADLDRVGMAGEHVVPSVAESPLAAWVDARAALVDHTLGIDGVYAARASLDARPHRRLDKLVDGGENGS